MPSAAYRDAEDLEQDIYNRVLEKIHTFESDKATIQTWVSRLARNIQIDHLRRQKLADEIDEPQWATSRPMDPHTWAALRATVRKLPQRQRDALGARLKNSDLRKIATQLGVSVSQVSKDLAKAQQTLLEAIE